MLLPLQHWRQRQPGECLVACAAMVMAYLERQIDYDTLHRRLRTSTSGTFFANLDKRNQVRGEERLPHLLSDLYGQFQVLLGVNLRNVSVLMPQYRLSAL